MYETMDAAELRDERDLWYRKVVEYARRYRQAVDAEDLGEQLGMQAALDTALAQVEHVDRLLKLGVAA